MPMRCLLALLALSIALLGAAAPRAAAQDATPAPNAPPVAACDIEPRPSEEIAALVATPDAEPGLPAALPAGEPAPPETVLAIAGTLRLATACAEAGDLPRLLALYTDRYIAEEILAAEPVPIVPGQPAATPTLPVATPPAAPAGPVIVEAVVAPDGAVAAVTVAGDHAHLVRFVASEARGPWQIDAVVPLARDTSPAGALDAPELAIARADAASRLGVDPAEVILLAALAREWPDAALGCPQPGMFYAQVITPGSLLLLAANGHILAYHAGQTGAVVLCANQQGTPVAGG